MAKRMKVKLPSGWKAEVLTNQMKKLCDGCGDAPSGHCRLVQTVDSYPYPTTKVFCLACGIAVMRSELQASEQLVIDFASQYAPS